MARAALPPLPLRDGVGPSCVAVPGAGWPTVLDFLAERLPTLTRDEWQHRLDSGQVLDAQGHPVAAELPCRGGLRLFYYRGWADEPALDGAPEQIVFQDDWLVVADKPHFMPVTPGGRFVQRSLLVRLRRRLGIDGLSPIHRIDRETAGLVAFAVQPDTRAGYQALFRDRAVHKRYEAVAPALQHGHARFGCAVHPLKGLADFLPHGGVHGVGLVGAVQAHGGDVRVQRDAEGFKLHAVSYL